MLTKCFRRDQLEKSRLLENIKKWHIRQVDNLSEYWALLACYTVSSGNYLLTFRDNPLVPSSRVKIGPETLVRNYHCSLHNSPEEFSSLLLHSRRA